MSFILGSLWGYQDRQKQKEYESNYNKNSAYYYENNSGQVENNQEKRSQEINNNINSYAEVNIDSMVKELDENALAASDKYYSWACNDPIHPRKAGYLQWWTPYIQAYLENELA